MNQTSMSRKGQIVIPKIIRETLNIKASDKLQITLLDDAILIRTIPGLEDVYGMIKVKKLITEEDIKKAKSLYFAEKFVK